MTTKRILFKDVQNTDLTKAIYELENLIETSKDVELFDSQIYFKKHNGKDIAGLSVIGIDGELFELVEALDLKIVKLGNEQYSYLDQFESRLEQDKGQIIVIDRNLESFRLGQIQKIVD